MVTTIVVPRATGPSEKLGVSFLSFLVVFIAACDVPER
jgi:hypothetical protein